MNGTSRRIWRIDAIFRKIIRSTTISGRQERRNKTTIGTGVTTIQTTTAVKRPLTDVCKRILVDTESSAICAGWLRPTSARVRSASRSTVGTFLGRRGLLEAPGVSSAGALPKDIAARREPDFAVRLTSLKSASRQRSAWTRTEGSAVDAPVHTEA